LRRDFLDVNTQRFTECQSERALDPAELVSGMEGLKPTQTAFCRVSRRKRFRRRSSHEGKANLKAGSAALTDGPCTVTTHGALLKLRRGT
jgi:hypothetical protein